MYNKFLFWSDFVIIVFKGGVIKLDLSLIVLVNLLVEVEINLLSSLLIEVEKEIWIYLFLARNLTIMALVKLFGLLGLRLLDFRGLSR